MADLDLGTALNMFKSGMQDLSFQRALSSANDQVQQIKSSEANEQQQRAQLQGVANQLTQHMAMSGVPATTMQQVIGTVAPPPEPMFKDANSMYMHGLLTGNQHLQDLAQQQQDFETPDEEPNPLKDLMFQEQQNKFTQQEFDKMGKDVDAAAASSRSAFGQWASTDARGQRLGAVLGDPSHWQNMTSQELGLVTEGVAQMSKGGVATDDEMKNLMPFMAKVRAAQAATAATGKPVPLDLSGFAQLYSNVVGREDQTAKSNMLDTIMQRLNYHSGLAKRDPDQFNLSASNALKQVGIYVNPNTISVDKKNGVQIPAIQQALDAADQAPGLIKQAYSDLNSSDPDAQKKAGQLFQSYGISPSMPRTAATRLLIQKIKASVFQ